MITFQFVLFFIIVYLCVYALINRVCQCVEHCATTKAYGKFLDSNGRLTQENMLEKINQEIFQNGNKHGFSKPNKE